MITHKTLGGQTVSFVDQAQGACIHDTINPIETLGDTPRQLTHQCANCGERFTETRVLALAKAWNTAFTPPLT